MKEREWCLYGIRLRQKRERSGAFMASGSVRKEKKEKKSQTSQPYRQFTG
jgi:hypothetical protein